jgi:voltage-gated potassium channel
MGTMKAMRYAKKTPKEERPLSPVRARLHEIIFESDTPAGKLFDVILLVAILLSVLAAILESVAGVRNRYGTFLYGLEWFFTILFTIEYLFRLGCVLRPSRYATSFFGIVDLMAIFPTYLSFFVVGTQSLLVIRILRLLRLFRVFKLGRYLGEARQLVDALKASRAKITVFLLTVLSVVIIMGALMYLVEGPENGFTSIPRGIYWAIVTMTTVGYGDIAPQTFVGQALAAIIMVLGYGIIAVPTGIFSANMIKVSRRTGHSVTTQICPSCLAEGHEEDAVFCKFCGTKL